MSGAFPTLADFTFRTEQREAFARGPLREHWFESYPDIFDDRDVRNVRNRPERHFYEWLVAVSLYHATGRLSLVEKYPFAHARKQESLRRLGADRLLAFFRAQWTAGTSENAFGRLQPPDLLLYDPAGTDYVFCEVKGPGDRLRPEQVAYFLALQEATVRPVYTVRLRPASF